MEQSKIPQKLYDCSCQCASFRDRFPHFRIAFNQGYGKFGNWDQNYSYMSFFFCDFYSHKNVVPNTFVEGEVRKKSDK